MHCCVRKASSLLSVTTLLAIIILFSVGPQLGSFDADGDGVPEVPIIVSNRSDTANFLPFQEHIQHSIFIGLGLSLFPAVIPDTYEYIGALVSELDAFTLLTFGPLLRC